MVDVNKTELMGRAYAGLYSEEKHNGTGECLYYVSCMSTIDSNLSVKSNKIRKTESTTILKISCAFIFMEK